MQQNFVFRYRNEGSNSYLSAVCNVPNKLIHYQVKMLENNEIPNLLSLNMIEHNGQEELFYDVTSFVTLEQRLSIQKMKRAEFLSLVNGLIQLCSELPEYQLPLSGILLESSYIFVRPGDFAVRFVYLPAADSEEVNEGIRGLLRSLVMRNGIESVGDNLIPELLELLNAPDFGLIKIKAFYQAQMNRQPVAQPQPSQTSSVQMQQPIILPSTPIQTVSSQKPETSAHRPSSVQVDPNQFGERYSPYSDNSEDDEKPKPPKRNAKQPKKKKTSKAPVQKSQKKSGTSPARLIFIVLQGVLAIAVGLLLTNGMLAGENGALEPMNLVGVLVAWAGIDFLLVRKLFSTPKAKALKEKNAVKPAATKDRPKPKMPQPPHHTQAAQQQRSPQPQQPVQPQRPPQPQQPRPMQPPRPQQIQQKSSQMPAQPPQPPRPMPQPVIPSYGAQPQTFSQTAGYDDTYEETVAMDDGYTGEACVTYYENGLIRRVKVQGRLLVGRQGDQVGLVLPSKRVGHIHAEILQQGGGYVIIDWNSKNGTYLNGSHERLTSNQPYPLKKGDIIKLADTEVTFEC